MYEQYLETLENLKKNSHFREIRNITSKDEKYIYFNGKKLLNLSSNNYLNFADNKKITEEFLNNIDKEYSFGSASARLLTGNLPIYNQLENLLSKMYSKDSALLFNSGYHANVGISSALCQKGDVIFSDKLNHASIIDGMKLSDGKFFRFPHNNMDALENLLKRERNHYKNAFIITESVFSMDGDIEDLQKIVELKHRYNCFVIVDEAHAFGVFGNKGLGVCETLDLIDSIDIIVGTFGKSIGSFGAFAVGNSILINYLINKSRSFIFSTAIPPINVAFTKWIIENKLPMVFEKRKRMLKIASDFNSKSHIIPIIIGDNLKTVNVCKRLFDNGYFTLPIRPPTVPQNTSRIRLSLTTDILESELVVLKDILNEYIYSKK